jgi:hypothetical protein
VTGASLIAFVLAIYLPHSFFKTWAERYVDFGRRKDSSQFDDLVAPILPSVVFHVQAWTVVHTICVTHNALMRSRWMFPGVDWRLLFTLSSDSSVQRLSHAASDWYFLMWPIAYAVVLGCVTFVNAVAYGRGALNGIYASADESLYPESKFAVARKGLAGLKVYVAACFFWAWKLVYYETFVAMFPWAVLNPFVFVKTKDALFHGRFESYEKSSKGEIETIYLKQVSRFTRRPIREALADGEHPLRPLKGVLVLKWTEVDDINTTTPDEIRRLWQRWEDLREKNVRPKV